MQPDASLLIGETSFCPSLFINCIWKIPLSRSLVLLILGNILANNPNMIPTADGVPPV